MLWIGERPGCGRTWCLWSPSSPPSSGSGPGSSCTRGSRSGSSWRTRRAALLERKGKGIELLRVWPGGERGKPPPRREGPGGGRGRSLPPTYPSPGRGESPPSAGPAGTAPSSPGSPLSPASPSSATSRGRWASPLP